MFRRPDGNGDRSEVSWAGPTNPLLVRSPTLTGPTPYKGSNYKVYPYFLLLTSDSMS